MTKLLKILFIVFCCSISLSLQNNEKIDHKTDLNAPNVNTRHGQIRGHVHHLSEWNKVYLYKGIPYAKAERFGRSHIIEKFDSEVYDALKDRDSCVQFGPAFLNSTGKSEDCLLLNIFKPIVKTNDLGNDTMPVMVFFHGIGFQSGSIFDSTYDATLITDLGKLLVVTVNYRLGPLGFLYAGTDTAPGNQGLHDQIMSLKWIHDNIEHFEGDPTNITIFGHSAGSVSVSALILSPLAKGLFHRAIMQSGTIVPTSLKMMHKAEALNKSIEFAKKLDCPADGDMTSMVNCLKEKTIEEIENVYNNFTVKDLFSNRLFGPIFDDEILPENSIKFIDQPNKIDLIFGLVRDEGSLFIPHYLPELMDYRTQMTSEKISDDFRVILSNFNVKNVDKIIDFYTKKIDPKNFYLVRKMFADFFADFQFNCPMILFAKKLAEINKDNKYYAYRFVRRSIISDKLFCYDWMGVCHGSDLLYTFSHPFMNYYLKDVRLSHDIIKSWTQFAQNKPTSLQIGPFEWPEAFVVENNQSSIRWMLLDVEYRVAFDLNKISCEQLWEKQYLDWPQSQTNDKDEL